MPGAKYKQAVIFHALRVNCYGSVIYSELE